MRSILKELGIDENNLPTTTFNILKENHNLRPADIKGEYDFPVGNIIITNTNNFNYNILDNSFENSAAITSITLPAGLQEIGIEAFRNCVHLTSITLPQKLKSIGRSAFNSCDRLKAIELHI